MEERKVFDKRNPTKGDRNFIPIPSDARHYVHHERMSAEKLFLYALIIDYYNPILKGTHFLASRRWPSNTARLRIQPAAI
ncbi:hypothetical protein ACFY5J_27105 [Peribacillus butanolivorans]|uniref:hypothetical protein n=1 Tax=Peribacillus butanolivorans TaxID=421767 RepID=UPI00367D82EE